MTTIIERRLINAGFEKQGKGYHLLVKQHGGYSDYVYVEPENYRIVIQNYPSLIELNDCKLLKRMGDALRLAHLDDLAKKLKI